MASDSGGLEADGIYSDKNGFHSGSFVDSSDVKKELIWVVPRAKR